MLKRALIYGALIAILGAAWTLIEYALGFHGENIETGQFSGFVALLFPIVGIVLAIRAAKRADPGPFGFGDGFKQGALTTVVAAALGAVFFYLYGSVINPDYAETTLAYARSQLEEQGFTGRELENALAGARAMSSPIAQALTAAVGGVIVGLIISAIAAAVMRRKPQPAGDGYGAPA